MIGMSYEEPLEIEVRTASPHALIALTGELDASNVAELYERLALLARDGICHLALNLAELTFIDSTGLTVLVAAHKRTQACGGELIIFSPRPEVRRTIELGGLADYLHVRPSTTEPCCSKPA